MFRINTHSLFRGPGLILTSRLKFSNNRDKFKTFVQFRPFSTLNLSIPSINNNGKRFVGDVLFKPVLKQSYLILNNELKV